MEKNTSISQKILLMLIASYQYCLSPLLGQHCRFYPSCSSYVYTAIQQHGCCRGIWMGLGRLLRCHPWCKGGYDPVPGCFHTHHGNSK